MALTPTYQLKTFEDIYTAVIEELKIQSTDTTSINRIKRDINITYLEEVVPFSQWKWLRGVFDATVYAAISAGTASVVQGSNTVTLSTAISSPKNGWLFSVIGYSEVYRILNHAATSTTLTLQVPFTGVTSATTSYKIWTDEVYLPSFVRETFEITHDFSDQALENCGLKKFRDYVATAPRAEGRPSFYTTNTFVDPVQYAVPVGLPAVSSRASNTLTKTLTFASSVANYLQQGDRIRVTAAGDNTYNGEFVVSTVSSTVVTYSGVIEVYETTIADTALTVQKLQSSSDSRRAKRVQVYPAIHTSNTTLHVDYIREAVPLADDDDEPLMPIGDRTILLYGALSRAWRRERNPDEAENNLKLFVAKLTRMAGKMDDSIDQPRLVPSKTYLGTKRMTMRQGGNTRAGLNEGWGGGGSGGQVVSGTANRAAKFDSTGNLVASTVTSTELGQLSGILSQAVGISDINTLTNKTLLDGSTVIANTSITTKTFVFSLAGQSSNTRVTLATLATTNRTYTLPDITDTLVTLSAVQTLTNKTFDAGANSLSGVTVNMMASSGVSATRLPFSDGAGAVHWQQFNNQAFSSSGTAATRVPFSDGAGGTFWQQINAQSIASSASSTGQVLTANGAGGAVFATPAAASFTAPTIQKFSSSAATYLTPASVRYLKVTLCGGGGGGAGGGSGNGTGSSGTSTTFGTSLLSALPGVGAGHIVGTAGTDGGQGGIASLGSAVGLALTGGYGDGAANVAFGAGGQGGVNPFGGAGGGGWSVGGTGSSGWSAVNNSGAGGGGGGGGTAINGGAGGGAGGWIHAIITTPSTAYPYVVGTGGVGGTAGTAGGAGGIGGSGVILVEEYYQ